MKRVMLLCAAVLLVSCTSAKKVPRELLPFEEVLANAARVNQNLESARFTVTGEITVVQERGMDFTSEFQIEGMMTNGGKQSQFTLDAEASVTDRGMAYSLDGTIEIIFLSAREMYLYLHALSVQPSTGLIAKEAISEFAGTWWLLPSSDQEAEPSGMAITPDPRILHAQAQVINVKKERGLVTINGREAYAYDVTLDPEKLIAYLRTIAEQRQEPFDEESVRARVGSIETVGFLAIDADNFYIHNFEWVISPLEVRDGTSVNVTFKVNVRDHGGDFTIAPPEDALLFSPLIFLGLPPGRTILFQKDQGSTLPDNAMQDFLEGYSDNPAL